MDSGAAQAAPWERWEVRPRHISGEAGFEHEATRGHSADEFAKDAAVGDVVTGRVVKVRGNEVLVQLGEGVEGVCMIQAAGASEGPAAASGSSLAEQLAAAWKGGVKPPAKSGSALYQEGELRSFKIKSIDASGKKIELTPA